MFMQQYCIDLSCHDIAMQVYMTRNIDIIAA